jgi:hypothetical protein
VLYYYIIRRSEWPELIVLGPNGRNINIKLKIRNGNSEPGTTNKSKKIVERGPNSSKIRACDLEFDCELDCFADFN